MAKLPPRILITGTPGVGKTTLVRKVVENLSVRLGGFYTEEIREQGKRVGFRLRTLDGQEGILAHVKSKSRFRVGKYGVEVRTFEEIAIPALDRVLSVATGGGQSSPPCYCPNGRLWRRGEQKGGHLVVMDELGRMELFSQKFQQKVMEVFDSSVPILAVIQDRRNPFLDAIRGRKDVVMFRVTEENRDGLVREIIGKLKEHVK